MSCMTVSLVLEVILQLGVAVNPALSWSFSLEVLHWSVLIQEITQDAQLLGGCRSSNCDFATSARTLLCELHDGVQMKCATRNQ